MIDLPGQGGRATHPRWVSVVADADPTVLPQLLGLVASINVCPTSLSARKLSAGQLEWACELEGVSDHQWQFLLRKLAQPTQVWSVSDLTADIAGRSARRAS